MESRNINGIKQVVPRVGIRSHDFAEQLLVNFQGLFGLAGLSVMIGESSQGGVRLIARPETLSGIILGSLQEPKSGVDRDSRCIRYRSTTVLLKITAAQSNTTQRIRRSRGDSRAEHLGKKGY